MNRIYDSLFEKIYKYFYFYCISGRSEERELLLKQQKDIERTRDNILIYFFQIMKFANGMDQDGRNRNSFFSKADECSYLVTEEFDQWCFYQILFLIYTYIYPDVSKAKENADAAEKCRKNLSAGDEKIVSTLTGAFDKEEYELEKHFDNTFTMKNAYDERQRERDFRLGKRSFLMILKGFSSSTPFFYPALEGRFYQSPIKGGGLFIKWQGYGIVIDPGINFMENMHINGLGIDDINAVIVTHDHIDHNGDLQVIDDLAYASSNRHEIEFYMDAVTSRNKSQMLMSVSDGQKHVLDTAMGGKFSLGKYGNIQVEFLATRHIPDWEETKKCEKETKKRGKETKKRGEETIVYQKNVSFALKISLGGDMKIGFTADTEYFENLSNFLQDCNYIIANMSEPEKNEYRRKEYKKMHLGYGGCAQLIETCNKDKPKEKCPRYIISEFWAGKSDTRRELIKKLRRETGYGKIYPGDIGMMFFLDRDSFMCDYCRCETNIEKLHLIRNKNEYGKISLICDDCLLF